MLDVARFAPPEQFGVTIDRHIKDIADSTPLPGIDHVRVPGQARAEKKQERLAHGVAISAPLVKQLNALAQRFGIPPVS